MIRKQLLITGIGGQGVLFLTRILATIAISKGLPVMTSENHGMAQRGGSVDSHVKIGHFTSPLIRSGHADFILSLHGEDFSLFNPMRSSAGWAVVNTPISIDTPRVLSVDATSIATQKGYPKNVNLAFLGAAIGALSSHFFVTEEDVEKTLQHLLLHKLVEFQNAMRVFAAGLKVGQTMAKPMDPK